MNFWRCFWKEISIPFKIICYNEKIKDIVKKHEPLPRKIRKTEDLEKWGLVLKDLLSFAEKIKFPAHHLYESREGEFAKNCKELTRDIREYAQARFGQLIGLCAIIIASVTLFVSIAAVIIAVVFS